MSRGGIPFAFYPGMSTSKEKRIRWILNQAEELLEGGEILSARELLEAVSRRAHEFQVEWNALAVRAGLAPSRRGHDERAFCEALWLSKVRSHREEEVLQALKDLPLNQLSNRMVLIRAFCHERRFEWPEAETVAGWVLGRDPQGRDLLDALLLKAEALLHRGLHTEGAQEEFTKAIEKVLLQTSKDKFPFHFVRAHTLRVAASALCEKPHIFSMEESKQALDGVHLIENGGHLALVNFWVALAEKNFSRAQGEIKKLQGTFKSWKIRFLEFYLAAKSAQTEEMRRVFFGSPMPALRASAQKWLKEHGKSGWNGPLLVDFGAPQEMSLNGSPVESLRIDLVSGRVNRGNRVFTLKRGQAMHRAFSALLSDFYRPPLLTELFSRIYPGEKYFELSSPAKLHQILGRLKRWFKSNDLPLQVVEDSGRYRLEFLSPVEVRVPYPVKRARTGRMGRRPVVGATTLRNLEAAWKHFSDRCFTAREMENFLGVSRRTINRQIKEGIHAGFVVSFGAGADLRYRVARLPGLTNEPFAA